LAGMGRKSGELIIFYKSRCQISVSHLALHPRQLLLSNKINDLCCVKPKLWNKIFFILLLGTQMTFHWLNANHTIIAGTWTNENGFVETDYEACGSVTEFLCGWRRSGAAGRSNIPSSRPGIVPTWAARDCLLLCIYMAFLPYLTSAPVCTHIFP